MDQLLKGVVEADARLSALDSKHRQCLQWFWERQGQEVRWPGRHDNGTFLVSAPKGIFKPEDWTYALSVRQTLQGRYEDSNPVDLPDGGWHYSYKEEGGGTYTNEALRACHRDGVPVGVLIQTTRRPISKYKVMGIAIVVEVGDGVFSFRGFPPSGRIQGDVPQRGETMVPGFSGDERERTLAEIVRRRGQGRFRDDLLDAYGGKCAITGFDVAAALDAAHIAPYGGQSSSVPSNGLLLRSDIHNLFDLGLIWIDESKVVRISPGLKGTLYDSLEGVELKRPSSPEAEPSLSALAHHRQAARQRLGEMD